MIRLPAVAGQFYPANPAELSALIREYTPEKTEKEKVRPRACLVPHAGYKYSGHVAGAVFSGITISRKVLLLGVRHRVGGEAQAILSEGAWRTPLGDAAIDETLAERLKKEIPSLREDEVAHRREHSLEVELPFLQVLQPELTFVPVALGTLDFRELVEVGEGVARILSESDEEILLVTSSDMNHYESDEKTREKDKLAIECLRRVDAAGLFETCRKEQISMCGLGPAVAMLTAMKRLGVREGKLVRYATSGDMSGERDAVVGYAGMIFV